MTDRPEDVLREMKNDYALGMASQGYADDAIKRLLGDFDAALSDLITERDRLAGWLKVVAQAQHQLLDQVKLNLTDDEWAAFSEALGLSASPPEQEVS